MVRLHPSEQRRLERLAENLHRCGARTVAEEFAEVAGRIGDIFAGLIEFEQRSMLAADGNRPRRVVPR